MKTSIIFKLKPQYYILLILLFVLTTVILSGCTASFTGTPDQLVPNDVTLKSINDLTTEPIVNSCLKNQTVECRNTIVYNKLLAIDINYAIFINTLFNEDRGINYATTLTTLGLSAAAGATGVTSLATIAAGLTGATAGYNSKILQDKIITSIQYTMEAQRDIIKSKILIGLSQTIVTYPLELANIYLQAYYEAGTLLNAVSQITNTTTQIATTAKDILQKVTLSSYVTTTTSSTLTKFILDKNGNIIDDNVRIIDTWLSLHNIKEHASQFINSNTPEMENYRQAFINELKINIK